MYEDLLFIAGKYEEHLRTWKPIGMIAKATWSMGVGGYTHISFEQVVTKELWYAPLSEGDPLPSALNGRALILADLLRPGERPRDRVPVILWKNLVPASMETLACPEGEHYKRRYTFVASEMIFPQGELFDRIVREGNDDTFEDEDDVP